MTDEILKKRNYIKFKIPGQLQIYNTNDKDRLLFLYLKCLFRYQNDWNENELGNDCDVFRKNKA